MIACVTDEDDLSFCGLESTAKHLTLRPATVEYDSECNICPDNDDCVTTKYYAAGTELIVTCWTELGAAVLGDTYVQLERAFLYLITRTPQLSGRLTFWQ